MKTVGIYGSPRKGGNTDELLDSALKGVQSEGGDVNSIYVRDLKISGCRGCDGCEKTGICIVKDDMQEIYPLLDDADSVILASPIFFYGMTSQIKSLIDRGQAMWARKRLNKKNEKGGSANKRKGYLIAIGATKGENLFECARLVAKYFFDALDMSYEDDLFFRGMESIDAAKKNSEAIQQAYEFGKKINF
ncbi:MAG: flavodoxin family protein [Thermodesulfobacteriota bacterium]|nr:flavodoxin family protein [Thermodesulfobacteriota bacterium]